MTEMLSLALSICASVFIVGSVVVQFEFSQRTNQAAVFGLENISNRSCARPG